MLQRARLAGLNWCMLWSKYVALRAQGLVINETVPTVLHQDPAHLHILLFLTSTTSLLPLKDGALGPAQIKSENMVWDCGWSWNGTRDVARVVKEKHIQQSENSTQRNTAHLCPSATRGKRQCCSACRAFSYRLSVSCCLVCSVLQGWAHWDNRERKASVPCRAEFPLEPLWIPEGISALL